MARKICRKTFVIGCFACFFRMKFKKHKVCTFIKKPEEGKRIDRRLTTNLEDKNNFLNEKELS